MTASRQEQIKVRNLIFKKCSFCLKPKSITKIAIKTSVLKERGSETNKKIAVIQYLSAWWHRIPWIHHQVTIARHKLLVCAGFSYGAFVWLLFSWLGVCIFYFVLLYLCYIDFINGLKYVENFFKEISWITKSILSLNPYPR